LDPPQQPASFFCYPPPQQPESDFTSCIKGAWLSFFYFIRILNNSSNENCILRISKLSTSCCSISKPWLLFYLINYLSKYVKIGKLSLFMLFLRFSKVFMQTFSFFKLKHLMNFIFVKELSLFKKFCKILLSSDILFFIFFNIFDEIFYFFTSSLLNKTLYSSAIYWSSIKHVFSSKTELINTFYINLM